MQYFGQNAGGDRKGGRDLPKGYLGEGRETRDGVLALKVEAAKLMPERRHDK